MEKDAEKKVVMELKQELQKVRILMEALTVDDGDGDDDLELQYTDSAVHTLRALKKLKVEQSDGGLIALKNLGIQQPPQEFVCPISGLLMTDPVATDCGQTYDKTWIRKWMREGNTKCGRCDTEACCNLLTPNHLLKVMILQWCKETQVSFIQEKCEEEMTTVSELKKDVQRDDDDDDDDGDLGFIDGIRELKLKKEPPQEFICLISGELMKNPVVASSGQTFEEACIAKWMRKGKTNCPKTNEALSHTLLIPNHSIKEMIAKWCKAIPSSSSSSSSRPTAGEEQQQHLVIEDEYEHLISLLEKFPTPDLSDQLAVLKELRLLTARLPSFRALFGEIPGATSRLLNPFMIQEYYCDAALYKEVVPTLLNICTEESIKAKIVQDCPSLIPFLVKALFPKNTTEIRGYAAAALSQLSSLDSNKSVIGDSGAVVLLIKLLKLRHPLASREAASAVLRLIPDQELVTYVQRLFDDVYNAEDEVIAMLHKILEIIALYDYQALAIEVLAE